MAQSEFSILTGSSRFLLGVPTYAQLKPTRRPEIALVGRSNVGKSSFLNRIVGATSLARVSGTPGKTQELNLFESQLRSASGENSEIIIADLPGFGFAKLSKSERQRMSQLTIEYISQRKELEVVVLLNDSKRLPEEDEFAIAKAAMKAERSFIIVLTKVDRLSQSERVKALRSISAAYEVEPDMLVLAGKSQSVVPFWNLVGRSLFGE